MGKRGRTPLPTPLKVLHGERRSSRLNHDAPRPSGPPVMPRGMSPRAQGIWRRQLKSLPPGIITAVDGAALRCYCEAVSRYEEAARLLEAEGPLAEGQRGTIKSPLHQIVRDNAMLVRSFAKDLGFLPSAREGLHVGSDKERDPLTAWMDDR